MVTEILESGGGMTCISAYLGTLRRAAPLHHVPRHHLAFGGRALVEFRIHPACQAFLPERLGEFPADERILLVIGDRAAALTEIDRAVVHELLARAAGLARALVVGAMPGGDAQPLLADSEMLV